MKAYFDNLNERERWTLLFGGALVFLFLFYWALYSPLSSTVDDNAMQLADKRTTLQWMEKIRGQAKDTQRTRVSLTNSQILTLLARQLQTTTFRQYAYQLQQMGSGDIQLSYEQVPYNPFMGWLWELQEKYALTIKLLSVDRTATPGVVKVSLMFSAS